MTQPRVIVIAGPNGTGKSTFAANFLDLKRFEFLNADEQAKQICPESPENAKVAAGQAVLHKFDHCLENKIDFLMESTISGRTLLRRLKSAQDAGFYTSVSYIFADSADVCVSRVGQRVRKGGHHVPHNDVVRRYGRSMVNFWHHYRFVVDSWALYYNSGSHFVEVCFGETDRSRIADPPLFSHFRKLVENHAQR